MWNVECEKCWNKFERKSGSRGKVCPKCRNLINKINGISQSGSQKESRVKRLFGALKNGRLSL